MAKPMKKLIPIIAAIDRTSAPIFLPTTTIAPNNPKTAPDAPTDVPYIGAKYAEANEPVRSEKKNTVRYFFLPKVLMAVWIRPDIPLTLS